MTQTTFLLKYGPWAVVTGASDGIGYAFANQLAALGLNVVLVARRVDRLNEMGRRMREDFRVETCVIAADLSTEEGRAEIARRTANLDIGLLVASAGYGTSGPLLEAKLERERNMLEVNCFAVLQQCVTFGNRLAKRGRGGIILMTSLVGWQGVPRSAHYAATKAYVQSLAEALRVELRSNGVDVLASAPGPVRSGFAERADIKMGATVLPAVVARKSLQALGRKGTVIPGGFSKLLRNMRTTDRVPGIRKRQFLCRMAPWHAACALLTYSLLPLPRTLRTRILAQVMGGMTRHQAKKAA